MQSKRGEVFLVDLGYVAKVRPCVVVSIPGADSQRNMSVVAPLTTEQRGGETEVAFAKPRWLNEPSVVNLIGLPGVDNAENRLVLLGRLEQPTMDKVDNGQARMLGL